MTSFPRLLAAAAMMALVPMPSLAQDALFDLGDRIGNRTISEDVLASYEVRIDPSRLEIGAPAELFLELPDALAIAQLRPVSPKNLSMRDGQAAWAGSVVSADSQGRDATEGEIFLTRQEDYLQARIVFRGRVFGLRTIDGLAAILEEFDPDVRDHPESGFLPDPGPSPKIGEARPDSECIDPPDEIDVMVLYTSAAKDAAGGVAAIENEIGFAVSQANFALANSNAFHRYNIVRMDQVSYDEATNGGASTTLLDQLRITNDMVMDQVHGWRDDAKADLVSLVTAGGECGWGYTPTNEIANADTTDHTGFAVFRRSCVNGNISVAHELGHNMGGLHNREDSGASSLPDDYNYGHRQPTPSDSGLSGWRTVMSYSCDSPQSCGRITQYSNPGVDFPSTNGDPTGIPLTDSDPEHNVMMFGVNDAAIAKYRCQRRDEEVANVWGKDTWADTGLEPDPVTAGDPMWRSPYIWVRNAQDVNDEFHHVHQNPSTTGDPHVYVKMLNDGDLSEAGDLELYFADASTQLNDPSNWTLIDAQSATFNTGTRVSDFPWSSLPGTGHYCLMARWNNDGSALNFTSIDGFVRGDGGVIWRNVNIVGPDGLGQGDEPLIVRGFRGAEETWLRITTRPAANLDLPWAQAIEATILVDTDILADNAQAIGLSGSDGKYRVPLNARVKFLGPLKLGVEDEAKAQMVFEYDQDVVEQLREEFGIMPRFSVSVQQVTPEAVKQTAFVNPLLPFPANLILGGVDYTLTLEKPD